MSVSVPATSSAVHSATATDWRRSLVLPLGLGTLLLGALFHSEAVAALQTWNQSTAYNHCFLIVPIALYLLWDRRFDLAGLRPAPAPRWLLLGLPLAAAWLIAERLGLMEGRQLVALSFLQVLYLTLLGKPLWRATAGPLLYLYFLVPFGEFLTPGLQDITTWFVRQGLDFLGIPAYVDGYVIEIPQGTFFVAEACAGLRFLIASVAFGCLYALLIYRSPTRRGLFILASIIVPVIANGLRGLGIVVLGYVLGSAQAAAADHVLYGWVFFSVIILLLIAAGLPFRQDHLPTDPRAPARSATPCAAGAALAITCGALAVAAIGPILATGLAMAAPLQAASPTSMNPGPDCVIQGTAPATATGYGVHTQRVICRGVAMDLRWEAFSPRSTAAPLMQERRRMVARALTEGLQQDWLQAEDESPRAWRIMQSHDPAFAVAVAVWIDGKPVRPGLPMRATMAWHSIFGSKYAPMLMTITPVADWDALNPVARQQATASLPAFLLQHPDLDRTVGDASAL